MLVENLQQKIHICQHKTYTFGMTEPEFDAEPFAKWLNEAFRDSRFKSFAEIAKLIKVSRTTISSYASARPQTVSNKPSRPKRENVIALASALNKDIDEALLLAGHAPNSEIKNIPVRIITEGFEGLDADDEDYIVKQIQYRKFLKAQEREKEKG